MLATLRATEALSTIRSEFALAPLMPTVLMLNAPPERVSVVPFFTRPPLKLSVPPPALMRELVTAVTWPEKVLVPVAWLTMAPTPPSPLPLMEMASAMVTPLTRSEAPLFTVVAPAVVPRPLLWSTRSVPLETVVAPVYVLLPAKTTVPPAPVTFTRPPLPLTMPLTVKVLPLLLLKVAVDPLAMLMLRLALRATLLPLS